MKFNQAKSVKPKMREPKLGSEVHSQGASKQKMLKTSGRKTRAVCIKQSRDVILSDTLTFPKPSSY
jgi:hypothetical protein